MYCEFKTMNLDKCELHVARAPLADALSPMAAVLSSIILFSLINRGSYFLPQRQVLIILVGCVAVYLVYRVIKLKQKLVFDWTTYCLLGLSTASIISTYWSTQPQNSLWAGLLMLSYAIFYTAIRCEYRIDQRMFWLQAIVLIGTMASLFGIAAMLFKIFPWVISVRGIRTASSFLEYPNALAIYAVMTMPAAIVLLFRSKPNSINRWLYFVTLQIMLQATFLTFSRAGYFFVAVLLMFCLASSWKMPSERKLVIVSLMVAAISGILIYLFLQPGFSLIGLTIFLISLTLYPATRIKFRLNNFSRNSPVATLLIIVIMIFAVGVSVFAVSDLHDLSPEVAVLIKSQSLFEIHDSFRFDTWLSSLTAWKDKSISGWGAGTFYSAYIPYVRTVDTTKFAHNIILQHMVELGTVGGVLILAFYLIYLMCVLRHVFARSWFTSRYAQMSAIAGGMFLFQNLFDFTWYFPGATLMFLANLAITKIEVAHHE